MWGALLLGSMLFVLAWIDLETRLLPDFLTIPLWLAGLLFNSAGVFASPAQAVLGGLAAWSIFWLAGALYRLWCGRDGLGGGDVKFAAALGSWLGWPQVPLLLLLSAVISLAAWGLLALFSRASRLQPFGPCLALGGLLLMLTPAI
ncbi:prepilin peptidase [Castellaniella sp.]|uniref:prepilin peptidase n=1 Tax=Castellaniella sp. TaxID=1955812 RepID=UPI003C752D2C